MATIVWPMQKKQKKNKEIVQIHKASFILQIRPIFIKSKIV